MEMVEHTGISVRIERHGRCVLHTGGNAAVAARWRQGRCECMLAARPL